MRRIGRLTSASETERFSGFLLTESIDAVCDHSDEGVWDVWIKDEGQVDRARQELDRFLADPEDARYDVGDQADEIRRARSAEISRRAAKVKTVRAAPGAGRGSAAMLGVGRLRQQNMPVTIAIIAFCVLISMWTNSISGGRVKISRDGQTLTPEAEVYFTMAFLDDRHLARNPGEVGSLSPERYDEPREYFTSIARGEVWRLVTPMFLHLSLMHLVFNMLWMFQLGQVLEKYHGSFFYLGMLVFCQVLAMLVQVMMPQWLPGPLRGSPYAFGASGAVYGLFGYLWIRPLVSAAFPIRIGNQAVYWMLGWLVICFTGVLGNVANGAHLGGLLAGMLFAALLPKKFS